MKLYLKNSEYLLTLDNGVIIASDNLEHANSLKIDHLNTENCSKLHITLETLINEIRDEFYESKLKLLGENANKVTLIKETAALGVGFDRGFKKAIEIYKINTNPEDGYICDVEIEMDVMSNAGFPIYNKPKLDQNGCLVLKRIN